MLNLTLDNSGKKAFAFFRKYDCFLEDFFEKLLLHCRSNSNCSVYYEIYRHIKDNYNQKENMLEIINRLIEIEPYNLEYESISNPLTIAIFQDLECDEAIPDDKINCDCIISIQKRKCDGEIIEVEGFKTNGDITWYPSYIEEKEKYNRKIYSVKITNADFVVKYRKYAEGSKRKVTIKNLLFNPNLLPTKAYEELKRRVGIVNSIESLSEVKEIRILTKKIDEYDEAVQNVKQEESKDNSGNRVLVHKNKEN